ncbi:MAG: fatty acid desaturase [Chthoniobacteraceae bacterium]
MTTSSDPKPADTIDPTKAAEWKKIVLQYQEPSLPRATWQIINTFVPYIALWWLMYLCMREPVRTVDYWMTLGCAILAGGFMIRAFIITHDCGHGSYFKSKTANSVWGFISGVVVLTPYHHWRWEHSLHHASSGDLDRRGTGDVWTMTVQEYLESSRWKKFAYRLSRNPVILFGIAPLFLFLIRQRFSSPKANLRERLSVWWMNLALLVVAVCLSMAFGWKTYLFLQVLVMGIAGSVGVWLFYVQHQFDGVYWARNDEWDYTLAALEGSSFYKLPKILQWFSGNIGYHHIHHLSSRIPNYNLERCHNSHPLFQAVKPVTLISSLKSFTYRLWDEQRKRLITYRQLHEIRQQHKRDQESAGSAKTREH